MDASEQSNARDVHRRNNPSSIHEISVSLKRVPYNETGDRVEMPQARAAESVSDSSV
jgi:hypothetical protein